MMMMMMMMKYYILDGKKAVSVYEPPLAAQGKRTMFIFGSLESA